MSLSTRPSQLFRAALPVALLLAGLGAPLASSADAAPEHVDPASMTRGAPPAVAYLVGDKIKDGNREIPATVRGRHDALWEVTGGYVVRDVNVGARELVRVTFISTAGEQRQLVQGRGWVDVAVSPTGRRVAVQKSTGQLGRLTTITVVAPRSGRVVARRELTLATLAAVTDNRVLVGKRLHWRDPASAWWNYRLGTWRRIAGQAALDADVRHDKVVFHDPVGEFCNRVAVLSRPARTLWRSCRISPHAWSPDGSRALASPAYFDAAGTDRWWVIDGRTSQRQTVIGGRLDWHAVWEDDQHFLTIAQGDTGQAAVIRCDVTGVCERASRLWDLPLDPDLYYTTPPVVLAGS